MVLGHGRDICSCPSLHTFGAEMTTVPLTEAEIEREAGR